MRILEGSLGYSKRMRVLKGYWEASTCTQSYFFGEIRRIGGRSYRPCRDSPLPSHQTQERDEPLSFPLTLNPETLNPKPLNPKP